MHAKQCVDAKEVKETSLVAIERLYLQSIKVGIALWDGNLQILDPSRHGYSYY